MIDRLIGLYETIVFEYNTILFAILLGWGTVFCSAYTWVEYMAGYNRNPKHFWRMLCWYEDSFKGYKYYYPYI